MLRAVRFEDTVLPSPDEFARPQHQSDKALNPKGILLQEGSYEKKLKNGRALTSRREKRYSTPAEGTSKMQNVTTTNEPPQLRHDHRSRRRSLTGGHLDSHQHHQFPHQYDPTPSHYRTPHSLSRRDNAQLPTHIPLSPARTQSFGAVVSHPYNPYGSLNRRDSTRWQDDIGYRSQAPYDAPTGNSAIIPNSLPGATTWTGYPGANPVQPPLGFMHMYGSSTATRSSTYYSPHSQADSRYLPDHLAPPKPSLKDVTIQRHLKHPRISWNIAVPLSTAAFDSHSKLSLSELDNTATNPAIDKMTIKFEHSKSQESLRALWRSLKIRGSCPYDLDGTTVFLITIRDVINSIFDFFQTPLTREEYGMLTNAEAQMVLHSQRRRAGRGAYGFGDPLRIDLLGDTTRFEGVRMTSLRERKISFGIELARW